MTHDRNQDPQEPTQDQPPPKQYATPRPGRPGERGTDERAPKIPDQMETSEGDDENQIAAEEGATYDENASVRGATGRSSSDKRPTPSGQAGGGSANPKPGAGTGQSPASGSRQTPGSGGSSSQSGSNPGGRSGK